MAMDKEIAEKVHLKMRSGMGYDYWDAYCPRCKAFLCPEPMIQYQHDHYCENCGQRLSFDVEIPEDPWLVSYLKDLEKKEQKT